MLCADCYRAQGPRKVTKSGGSKKGRLWRAREREPITGVWGQSPQWGPGAEPLVRGKAPLKLKSFLLLHVHWKRQICPYSPCIADSVNYLYFQSNTDSGDRPESHLGLRSRLDLAPKRLESRQSHHLMTRLDLKLSWLKSATCTMTIIV